MPISILRLPGVYGQGDNGRSTINRLVESAIKRKHVIIYGDGEDKRDFIYVGDICKIIGKTLNKKLSIVLNIVTGNSYSIKKIVEMIKSNSQEKFIIEYKPKQIGIERVKDMVYDTSLFSSIFPDIKLLDLKDGISMYLKDFH